MVSKVVETLKLPEMRTTEASFDTGKFRAQKEGKRVLVTRKGNGGKVIPIMEFAPYSGDFSEINAPHLRVPIMEQMLARIEHMPTNKQTTKKLYQYAGVEQKMPPVEEQK